MAGTVHAFEIRKVLAALACAAAPFALAACAGSLPDLTQAHGPCTDQAGGWCSFTRKLADETFAYAAMSNNAYCAGTVMWALPPGYTEVGRDPELDICMLEQEVGRGNKGAKPALALARAKWKAEHPDAPSSNGFSYALYDRKDPKSGALLERIIAFRGTDAGQIADWIHGNFGSRQLEMGDALYAFERKELDAAGHAKVPISVTGHSLGGAIALQVSVDYAGVDAYVFNPSPHYSFSANPPPNRRVAIVERGEFLSRFRAAKMPARQELLVINCMPGRNPFTAHSIRRLTECLTWIAARDDPRAKRMLEQMQVTQPPAGEIANREWGLDPAPTKDEAQGAVAPAAAGVAPLTPASIKP